MISIFIIFVVNMKRLLLIILIFLAFFSDVLSLNSLAVMGVLVVAVIAGASLMLMLKGGKVVQRFTGVLQADALIRALEAAGA